MVVLLGFEVWGIEPVTLQMLYSGAQPQPLSILELFLIYENVHLIFISERRFSTIVLFMEHGVLLSFKKCLQCTARMPV